MTTDQFNKSLDAKIAAIEKENKPLLFAVKSVMAIQSKRIFLDAKDNQGSSIGNYSGKEIYVSPDFPKGAERKLPKFPLKGKEGKAKFENGKPHKTGYFQNYLTFKKAIGRNKRTDNYDLILTGDLSRDWANSEVVSKAEATKISPSHYQVTLKESNFKKIQNILTEVFYTSANEKALFLKVLQAELGNAMRNA